MGGGALGCEARLWLLNKQMKQALFVCLCVCGGGVDQRPPSPREALHFLKSRISNGRSMALLQNPLSYPFS